MRSELNSSIGTVASYIPPFLLSEFDRWWEITQVFYLRVLFLVIVLFAVLAILELFLFVFTYFFTKFVAVWIRVCGAGGKMSPTEDVRAA